MDNAKKQAIGAVLAGVIFLIAGVFGHNLYFGFAFLCLVMGFICGVLVPPGKK